MKVIAFSGKATSGKTAASMLLGDYLMYNGHKFRKVSFADALRKMAIDWFPVDIVDLRNRKAENIQLGDRSLTVRQLLIELGCKMREIQPDFWVQALWREIQQHLSPSFDDVEEDVIYAIDDMRFPNEYDFFKKMGAHIIRIERPGVELIDDISETSLDNHEFDAYIENNGDLEDLKQMTLQSVEEYLAVKQP